MKVLRTNFVVKFTVDDVAPSLDCVIGVKQGDILGLILFTFLIAVAMITWKPSCNIPVCMFRSKMDATLTGPSYQGYGESFPVLDTEYADYTVIIFQSRVNFSDGVSSIIPHLARFGTKIHTEFIHPRRESKTETLFCSKSLFVCNNTETLDDTNLSDVIAPEQNYVPIIDHFKYLGSFNSR